MREDLEKGMGYVVMNGKAVLSHGDKVRFSETLVCDGVITIKMGFCSIQKRGRLNHLFF